MAVGGHITGRIEEAAEMAALGLDPFRYLYCKDPLELSILIELHNKTAKKHELLMTNLAIEIANQVSQLFKK